MWPLIASMVGRAAASVGAREAAGSAVGAVARSGAISAGTSPAAGSRVLSTMQFGSAAARAAHSSNDTSQPASAPVTSDQMGWARS